MKGLSVLLVSAFLVLILTGCASSGKSNAKEASRYSHRMHNRFYEAWVPPRSLAAPRGKISVAADITIDRDGRIRRFVLAKPSGYEALDKSIVEVNQKIKRVAPPPDTSAEGRFHLRVFFDLDVRR